nr:CPBP family intramembrane glutamic endopeptidase [Enterococcus rivorum]
MAVLTLLSFLISIYFVGINDSEGIAIIVSFIVVALTEEFYSRGVLYSEIERMWGRQTAVLLSSFIFAFLFHSNSEFVVNLLFRLPIALLLGILRKKTNSIYIGSAVHYIYNIIVNL